MVYSIAVSFSFQRYSIKKPPNKKIFVIDLDVAACFENDGSCLIEVPLMKGSEVPQPGCDMSATINFMGKCHCMKTCLKGISIQ